MMHAATRMLDWIGERRHQSIAWILVAAFLLRLAGIRYGLPMWLVGDEPSLIFGALKMIELKTLVPSLHESVFAGTFYYGVYLPYVYLAPFLTVIGFKFLAFSGTFAELKQALIVDTSVFFFIARVVSAVVGTATVYVVYRAAQELFQNERTSLASAAFLALSLLHVDFSHWARHWIPVTFCFALVLFALARRDWSQQKRYVFASLIAGVGVGISIQAGLAALLILLWFFFVDRLSLRKRLQEKWMWASVGIFCAFVFLAFLLWTKSFDFLFARGSADVAQIPKTLSGLIAYFGFHACNFFTAEPIFFLCMLLGAVLAFKRARGVFFVFVGFSALYLAIFYAFFTRFDRYLLMLYPLFALLAGYGLTHITGWLAARNRHVARAALCVVFLQMAVSVLALDARLIRNDTRLSARRWVESHVPRGAKIAILVPFLRLPKTAAAVDEQERLDPTSIRSIDRAERALPERFLRSRFHAVEFSALRPSAAPHNLPDYLSKKGYDYLLISSEYVVPLLGERVIEFPGYAPKNRNGSFTEGFGDGFRELFRASPMGADIVIRKLREPV